MSRVVTLTATLAGTPLGETLAKPEDLFASPSANVLKDHRRTAVARVSVDGREVYVKRFKPYAWYRRLEGLWGGGPARRSWQVAPRIAARGFRPATLLALVETYRWGLPADDYLVSAAVAGGVPAGSFWLESVEHGPMDARRRFLRAAGTELRRLHDAGFYSRDANANNFLVCAIPPAPPEFWLIDLETFREVGHVSHRRRLKNLAQLHNLLRGRVKATDRLRVLSSYLGPRRDALREISESTVVLDRRKAREYAKRRERAR
jgi:hypothetical protein